MLRLLSRSSRAVLPQLSSIASLTVAMPTTRSASRAAAVSVASAPESKIASGEGGATKSAATKRKQPATKTKGSAQASKKSRSANGDATPSKAQASANTSSSTARDGTPPVLVPATLTFSFEDAKKHLIAADHRFEGVFSRMKCRPFEHLEQVDPFRLVCTRLYCASSLSTRAPER